MQASEFVGWVVGLQSYAQNVHRVNHFICTDTDACVNEL